MRAHPLDDGTAVVLEHSIEATVATLDTSEGDRYRSLIAPPASGFADTQAPTAQDQEIQQLQDKLDEIQKELIDTPYATKFFSPEICSEVNYTYDFRHPQDDTNSGSSEVLSGFPL